MRKLAAVLFCLSVMVVGAVAQPVPAAEPVATLDAPGLEAPTDAGPALTLLGEDAVSQAAIQLAEKIAQAAELKRGDVVDDDWNDIAHPTVWVALGSKDGILQGAWLDVYSQGDPILDAEGKTLGHREKLAGRAKVTELQNDKLCVARVETIVEGQRPGKGCVAKLRTVPGTLAIAAFENPAKPNPAGGPAIRGYSKLGVEFGNKLATAIQVGGRMQAVGPDALGKLLLKHKLPVTGMAKAEAAALREELKSEGLVLAAVTQHADKYAVSLRVYDIATAALLASLSGTCPRDAEADRGYGEAVGWPKEGDGGGGSTEVVKLFEALKPMDGSLGGVQLGTCPIGGNLHDECVGYSTAENDRPWLWGESRHVIFDLKGKRCVELRAVCGRHDTNSVYQYESIGPAVPGGKPKQLLISTDGKMAGTFGLESDNPQDMKVPLTGVRMLRLDLIKGGIVVAGDFELVIAGE